MGAGLSYSAKDYCLNETDGQPWAPNMELVDWQRWFLLAGCILSALSGVYICISYFRNPPLRRRPGSLLYYRSLCNLGFAVVIIVNEIHYAVVPDSFPDAACLTNVSGGLGADCVSGGPIGCRTSAFFVQWFILAGESYYFAITLDLLGNLFLSPFGSQSFRLMVYHCATISLSTILAVVLVNSGDAEEGSWGPSCVVLRHVCWLKRFAVPGISGDQRGGWLFYYVPLGLYYISGIAAWLFARRSLSKGLPRTFDVRKRQLEAGRRLVTTLTLFVLTLFIFLQILVFLVAKSDRVSQENNFTTKLMRIIFAFWIGSSGLWNFVVWVTVVVPLARRNGFRIRPWWESRAAQKLGVTTSSGSAAGSRDAIARRRSTASGLVREPLMEEAAESVDAANDSSAVEDSGTVPEETPDGEELNLALQAEVLYFTLLGLRAAASGEHLWWKNNSHGDAGVDLVSAIRSGLSITPPGSFTEDVDGSVPAEIEEPTTEDEVDKMRGALDRMKFSFTSYSHEVMQEIRDDVFGVDGINYATSLCGHKDARFDGGKSGAIFFFSADQRYIIKEVTSSERKTLVGLLPGYRDYMRAHCQTSMLPRIVQCCSIYMYRKTLNFMVMENIFYAGHYGAIPSVIKPNAVYDIKGSWVDRNASGTRSKKPESGTFKDNDLTDVIYLPSLFRKELVQTLERDTRFLAMHKIMDYSLLLGVIEHRRFMHPEDRPLQSSDSTAMDGNTTPFFRVDGGGLEAAVIEGPGAYHMGLIDILQVWDWSKELERFAKVRLLRKDGDGLSAIEPMQYQRRFMENLEFITMDAAEVLGADRQTRSSSDNSLGNAVETSLATIRAGRSVEKEPKVLNSRRANSIDDSVETLHGAE